MPEDFAGPNLIPRASCRVSVKRKRGSVRLRGRDQEWEKDKKVKQLDGRIERSLPKGLAALTWSVHPFKMFGCGN